MTHVDCNVSTAMISICMSTSVLHVFLCLKCTCETIADARSNNESITTKRLLPRAVFTQCTEQKCRHSECGAHIITALLLCMSLTAPTAAPVTAAPTLTPTTAAPSTAKPTTAAPTQVPTGEQRTQFTQK
eukprot:3134-Heterococcus_DN1.PRE.3